MWDSRDGKQKAVIPMCRSFIPRRAGNHGTGRGDDTVQQEFNGEEIDCRRAILAGVVNRTKGKLNKNCFSKS